MDDFPAGPASPAPERPRLSVVIPVYNGGSDLERCLRGVRSCAGVDACEILVVDDGSTDDSAAIGEEFGAIVLRNDRPRGPAFARNLGARAALAPLVFFLDSDVVPHQDAIQKAIARFDGDPGLSALFGSYDDDPAATSVVSRYRNLLHHYVHQQGQFQDEARPAHTFWTGLGAIRREDFLGLGGFDPFRYRRPAIEDIELGYRLGRAGKTILLCRDIQATHLKRWTLRKVLITDIFHRGVPWMLLMMRSKTVEPDLNVSRSQRVCVAAVGLGWMAMSLAIWYPAALVVPLLAFLVQAVLNRDFYRFLVEAGRLGFRPRGVPATLCLLLLLRAVGGDRPGHPELPAASRRARRQRLASGRFGRRFARLSAQDPLLTDEEAVAMDKTVKVAVVRSDNRRGAVAQALALIADDLKACMAPHALIKPNLVSHRRQLPSTHAQAFSATMDAVFAAGAREITVAEGASDASAGFDRFGLRRQAFGRPVEFFDINRQETDWDSVQLSALDGSPLTARVSKTIVDSPCRVSLALAKTHVSSLITLSLKNMLSSIHPEDRVMMHGSKGGGNGYEGWKRLAVEFLKGDSLLVNWLTRGMGRAKNAKNRASGKDRHDAWKRLAGNDLNYVRSVHTLSRNLVALSRSVLPHVSIIDGFDGMHREGPRHGTPIRLGVAVASTCAVAADAVMASVMGFNPLTIGHIAYAEAAGLGTANLDAIEVVGDPIAKVRKRFVPHSNAAIGRHWNRLAVLKGPHARVSNPVGAR